MKVIALGAGEMGRWAVQTVLLDERVEQLVLADLERERCQRGLRTRIISARKATRRERNRHEEGIGTEKE